MKETAIVSAILDWAWLQRDVILDRVQSGRLTKQYKNKTGIVKNYAIRLAQAGSADIWGTVRDMNGVGRSVYVECKIPGENIEEGSDQERFKIKVTSLGAIHITAHAWTDVPEALKPYRRAIQ